MFCVNIITAGISMWWYKYKYVMVLFELWFVVAPKSATFGLTVVTVSLMCKDAIFALR